MAFIADVQLLRHQEGFTEFSAPAPSGDGTILAVVIVRQPRATINFAVSPAVTEAPIIRADSYLYVGPKARFYPIVGPPAGIGLEVENSSNVWETIWTYVASS